MHARERRRRRGAKIHRVSVRQSRFAPDVPLGSLTAGGAIKPPLQIEPPVKRVVVVNLACRRVHAGVTIAPAIGACEERIVPAVKLAINACMGARCLFLFVLCGEGRAEFSLSLFFSSRHYLETAVTI